MFDAKPRRRNRKTTKSTHSLAILLSLLCLSVLACAEPMGQKAALETSDELDSGDSDDSDALAPDADLFEPYDCVDGTQRVCGSSIGACRPGTQVCVGGRWLACSGGQGPVPELCNGIDDDCNGFIDNDLSCDCVSGQSQVCGSDVGACQQGSSVCVDGAWSDCDHLGPSPETCNGVDDDCNGAIDDACVCHLGTRVMVDNDLPGSGYSEERAENWTNYAVNACHGTYRYLSSTVGDGSRRGKAFWRPTLPIAGYYRVITRYRATENRSTDADYAMYTPNAPPMRRVVNQRDGSGCIEVDLGLHYCEAGSDCYLELDGSDDNLSDAADLSTFTLERCDGGSTEPPSSCAAIAQHPGYELCHDGGIVCHGVYTDGAGCAAFCAAAGMRCVARFGGEPGCQKEADSPIACDAQNGHLSDWCECAR
ncbi:MAG: MopE-related protein [Myxococcota bacterium]|jgi:hypothetical protein|nr:MopE-related protein [Myxococcota bacterium]